LLIEFSCTWLNTVKVVESIKSGFSIYNIDFAAGVAGGSPPLRFLLHVVVTSAVVLSEPPSTLLPRLPRI